MFSKKSQEAEEIISFDSNDARTSYRVSPPPSQPIRAEFQGKPVTIRNIGAAGMAFPDDHFRVGDSHRMEFVLPGENLTVSAETKIVGVDDKGLCHCRFVGLRDDFFNAIHRYMLAVQVQEVRTKKRASSHADPETQGSPWKPGNQMDKTLQ